MASFEGAASKGKTFVRGNIVNPGQTKGIKEYSVEIIIIKTRD